MCPHVGVQAPLRFKHLPTHFAPGAGCPIVILVRNVHLILLLTLVAIRAPPIVSAQALGLLQAMDDEEVAGKRPVGGVAQAALLALVGRAVALVLGNVSVKSCEVLAGEAADSTLVHFEDVHFEPL